MMKPSYSPALNAAAGKKGSIDGAIVAVSAVAAAGATKLLIKDGDPAIENLLAGLIASAAGALVGYIKRRYTNWRKNR